jgi:hypothetical protein
MIGIAAGLALAALVGCTSPAEDSASPAQLEAAAAPATAADDPTAMPSNVHGAPAPDGMPDKPATAAAARPGKPAAVDPPAAGQALEFLVKFKAGHPMARAQQLAAEGNIAEAEKLARRTLTSRADLAGLCLKGFTIGGGEVVLQPCEELPARRHDSAARQWLKLLRGQGSVAYADRNVVLQPGSETLARPQGVAIPPPKP